MNRGYTHPSVLEGIAVGVSWADPVMDPSEIDWPARQAAALIPFEVMDGRPLNPFAPTGIRYGRNEFGHWGEAAMADALVTVNLGPNGPSRGRKLLLVERGDGHGWAVPGGHIECGETRVVAALRELREETGLAAHPAVFRAYAPRYVPDPRASDEAWAVTVPVRVFLGERATLPAVAGGDDARRAEWLAADSYEALETALRAVYGGTVFAAHADMLREFLG